MTDSFRVTIVATAPTGVAVLDPGMEETVNSLSANQAHLVLRAAHMEDVADRIDAAWDDPRRGDRKLALQIVGHGSSGLLHLGSSWMRDPNEMIAPEAFADPFYLLDTNPWALAFIAHHRGHFDKVTLVACRVGASDAEGYATNGRTLAYTMCEDLQTTVFAAMDFNDPTEYDANGDYQPSADHLKPCSWTWRAGKVPVYNNPNPSLEPLLRLAPNLAPHGPPVQFTIESVRACIPSRARERPVQVGLTIDCVPLTDQRLLAAAPELRVVVTADPSTATIVGNGRVLRHGEQAYAIQQSADFRRKIAALLSTNLRVR